MLEFVWSLIQKFSRNTLPTEKISSYEVINMPTIIGEFSINYAKSCHDVTTLMETQLYLLPAISLTKYFSTPHFLLLQYINRVEPRKYKFCYVLKHTLPKKKSLCYRVALWCVWRVFSIHMHFHSILWALNFNKAVHCVILYYSIK